MSDPNELTAALATAEDAFDYVGRGMPDFEDPVSQEDDWRTQLTKACRYLEASRALGAADGYHGAVVELSFGAIERTLEAYLLDDTRDTLTDFQDHGEVYDRAAERGLLTRTTAEDLQALYESNRTEHYYGALVPTQQQEDALHALATEVHNYTVDRIRTGGVCVCL